jgi:very-short-patch-repair endonuclease
VVDFYCHESKLVIELDGSVDEGVEAKKQDQLKAAWLIEAGIIVLRFCDDEVIDNPRNVLLKIAEHL